MDVSEDRQWIAARLKIGEELLYLTRAEVMGTGLTEEDILGLTRDALVAHGHKRYEMPAKIGVHPYPEVFFHAMPAYVPAKKAVGMKWIECYPNNPERFGLPQTTGLLVLNDVASGCPLALMDATWITAMRTPAVTVLAAEALHPDAETFGMFGCGVQGIEHCKFVVHRLKKLQKIYIHDIREEAMDRLIREVQPLIDVEIVKGSSPEQVTKSCQVLSSATVILLDPLAVVKDAWVSAGQTLLPCDLNTFWDPVTSRRANRYIVDSADEHRLFADMGYFPEGLPEIACETGEVVAGLKAGRTSPGELIVCSNIGMAVCDVVVGRAVLERALEAGMGRKLPL
jgi:ornithine cyclodeaminase/alanine dehydrogenase-like protein (mu-crystallin family)